MSEATPRRLVAHGAVAELIDDPGSSPVGLVLAPTPAEPDIDHVDRADLGRQVRGGMQLEPAEQRPAPLRSTSPSAS